MIAISLLLAEHKHRHSTYMARPTALGIACALVALVAVSRQQRRRWPVLSPSISGCTQHEAFLLNISFAEAPHRIPSNAAACGGAHHSGHCRHMGQ